MAGVGQLMAGPGRIMVVCGLALLILAAVAPVPAAAETVITVRAEGHGPSGPGETVSLAAALTEAREARHPANPAQRGPIVIELEGGRHALTSPVELTEQDSGTPDRPLIIRGAASRRSTLTGAIALRQLPSNPGMARGYPVATQPHLAFFAVPTSVPRAAATLVTRRFDRRSEPPVFEIFDNKGRLMPARWPNEGWGRGTADTGSKDGRAFNDGGVWKGEIDGDVWMSGFPRHDWAFETNRLAARDAGSQRLMLADRTDLGFAESFRFAIHHARADLDTPGEWHHDRDRGVLALWPRPDGGPPVISAASGLLVLKGVRHVRIERLTLEHARGDAIFVRGGHHIEITGVTIRNVGGWGVAFEGATESFVAASRILEVGEGGVILSGGDRAGLVGANLQVRDTVIQGFGRLGLSHRPAISLHGVGGTAHGNFIADGPHTAIDFTGNDHSIELNEITRVVRETGDAGAIYTGRDWTAQGTRIKGNFLHDIRAGQGREVKGIYLDDLASGIRIENNVFLRVDQPVFIGGGRDNNVLGNLFIASEPGIHIDGRGLTWAKEMATRRDGQLFQRLAAMPVTSQVWRNRYPELATLLVDEPAAPKRNKTSGNHFIAGQPSRLLPEVKPGTQRLEPVADAASWMSVADVRRAVAATRAADLQSMVAALKAQALGWPLDRMDRHVLLDPVARP